MSACASQSGIGGRCTIQTASESRDPRESENGEDYPPSDFLRVSRFLPVQAPEAGPPSLRTRLCQVPLIAFRSFETTPSRSVAGPNLLSIRWSTSLLLTKVPCRLPFQPP